MKTVINPNWWCRRTLEPVFAYIALVGLVSGLAEATPVEKSVRVCDTPACVHAASAVIKKMNFTADPCDNFYQYVCGSYIDGSTIPEDKRWINSFATIEDKLREYIKDSITKESLETDLRHQRLPGVFYKACMNTGLIEQLGIKPMEEITKGWPVIVEDCWVPTTWQETTKEFRKSGFGINYIVDVFIDSKLGDNTKHIINLDQPALGLQREYLVQGVNNTFVKAYYEYMVDIAVLFGANKETAKKELMESLLFEIKLADISWPNSKRRNSTALYNLYSIKQLQESFPFVQWLDFLNALMQGILILNDGEIINLSVPSAYKDLGEVLNNTSDRVIANYMMWRAHDNAVDFLSEKFRERKLQFKTVLTGKKSEGARWKECADIVTNNLSPVVGSKFVQKHFKPESKKAALEMITYLRKAFGEMLENAKWMDQATRNKAKEKLSLLNAQIGYPEELLDDTILGEYYRTLVDVDAKKYLKSTLMINAFHIDKMFKKLRLPKSRTDWTTFDFPHEVNAFYSRTENTIKFPAGILQAPLFDIDYPKYINFGGMGYMMGHEFSHAFDDRGSLYDGNGNLLNWWQNDTRNAYMERVKCIIEQFNNYTDQQTGLKLNGKNTQGENIADNAGIKQSYLAYTQWLDEQDEDEPRLPKLEKYTSRQMFWISGGQFWCAKHRDATLKEFITTGVHAPSEFRILGPFSNMESFSKDFGCIAGAPMNPSNKCAVW